MSHMTEVVEEDTGMCARSLRAMWEGWSEETVENDREDILQNLFLPKKDTKLLHSEPLKHQKVCFKII